jgi:hypothetical protein
MTRNSVGSSASTQSMPKSSERHEQTSPSSLIRAPAFVRTLAIEYSTVQCRPSHQKTELLRGVETRAFSPAAFVPRYSRRVSLVSFSLTRHGSWTPHFVPSGFAEILQGCPGIAMCFTAAKGNSSKTLAGRNRAHSAGVLRRDAVRQYHSARGAKRKD